MREVRKSEEWREIEKGRDRGVREGGREAVRGIDRQGERDGEQDTERRRQTGACESETGGTESEKGTKKWRWGHGKKRGDAERDGGTWRKLEGSKKDVNARV